MKYSIIFCTILSQIFFSCAENKLEEEIIPTSAVDLDDPGYGRIPSSAKIYEYVINSSKYSWKDVDQYYRQDILVRHKNKSYFDNLRKMTIISLDKTFGITQKANKDKISFYINEIQTLNLIPPETILHYLESQRGFWKDEKIKKIALKEYEREMLYIKSKLLAPEKFLEKREKAYEALKSYAYTLSIK